MVKASTSVRATRPLPTSSCGGQVGPRKKPGSASTESPNSQGPDLSFQMSFYCWDMGGSGRGLKPR